MNPTFHYEATFAAQARTSLRNLISLCEQVGVDDPEAKARKMRDASEPLHIRFQKGDELWAKAMAKDHKVKLFVREL